MKKQTLIIIVLALIIVILVVVLIFVPAKKPANAPVVETGINITSINRMDSNSLSDIKIKGYVNGDDWIAFEGQVGVVKFLDKDSKETGYSILTVVGDWMLPPPINFEATMRMTPQEADSVATLSFKNENPSGDPERNKVYILPVRLERNPAETMSIKVYFNNSKMDPEFSCNKVFPAERIIPKTQAVAMAALEELFKGLTIEEKNNRYLTNINAGVKIQSLTIENGVARADFNEQLQYQVGGSCRVSAIRAQITETLKQFPTINNVIISIDGRTEDILQP